MRKLFLIVLVCIVSVNLSVANNANKKNKSNRQKAVELIRSIETGATKPISYINPEKYIQHNQMVADGLAGFGEVMKQLPKGSAKAEVIRSFQDGQYVVTHTRYNFFGPKIGFDIFRFENGKIVEHWDNLQGIVKKTASGRSQIDGPVIIKDRNKTDDNKSLVNNFVRDVLMGKNPKRITDYISTVKYYQHNPGVKDGLSGLAEAIKSLNEANMPMIYTKNHIIIGEGNFILSVSEGTFMNKHVSFYDLFRIENGKIVEHWDTIENILPESKAKNRNGKFNF
jgi:predicted SnoaL-like aldol condensation-catalyzing enzyme